MKHQESTLQRLCVKWFRLQYPQLALLLHANPNGGKRSRIEAAIMKGEGVTAGVPDLELNVPSCSFPGLFIEMKSEKGTLSESQRNVIIELENQGYKVAVCRTFDEFKQTIESYLEKTRYKIKTPCSKS